jgi:hypothetical protein
MTRKWIGCIAAIAVLGLLLLPYHAAAAQKTVEIKVPLCE